MATSTIPLTYAQSSGTLTCTISTGNATFNSGSYKRVGNAIQVSVNITNTTALSEGGTIQGTLSGLPSGISTLNRTIGWGGTAAQIISISATGALYIRNVAGTLATNSTIAAATTGIMSQPT